MRNRPPNRANPKAIANIEIENSPNSRQKNDRIHRHAKPPPRVSSEKFLNAGRLSSHARFTSRSAIDGAEGETRRRPLEGIRKEPRRPSADRIMLSDIFTQYENERPRGRISKGRRDPCYEEEAATAQNVERWTSGLSKLSGCPPTGSGYGQHFRYGVIRGK